MKEYIIQRVVKSLKKFHVRDGMGVNILLRNGIKIVIVTKEALPIVKKWSKDMNVSKIYSGVKQKERKLSDICKNFKLKEYEIAYIGDDVNDFELLNSVGFSATPNNAISNAKKLVDYVCICNRGEGSFREMADLILSIQFPNKTKWY